MNEKDIYTNTVVLFLVNRGFLEKKCPMGWDGMGYPKYVFVPWAGMIIKIFRPVPRAALHNT
jgi:hypothetical protein